MDSEIDHVQIEVSEEKGYILVKPPKGINFWEILTAIGKLLPQDGFLDKHDIWVFGLKGEEGDNINAVLSAAGMNFTKLLRWLSEFLRLIIASLLNCQRALLTAVYC
jgi:hypothetical protein